MSDPPPTGSTTSEAAARAWGTTQRVGFGLACACLVAAVAVPAPDALGPAAWRTACVGLAMACLWVTEAVPVAATALLPLIVFPLLGIAAIEEAAAPYGHKLIFLFLGGFCVALAMERWDLHRRLALHLVRLVGTGGRALVLGFMVSAALLSMWVSNTATALMMFPIGLSVVELLAPAAAGKGGAGREGDDRAAGALGTALLLGIAYGANIGGMGTIIGTPPNTVLVATLEELFGIRISFVQWMAVGVPLVLVGIPLAHLLLTRVCFPETGRIGGRGSPEAAAADALLREELARLGPMTGPERRVLAVFLATAAAWVLRPVLADRVPGLDDTVIAVAAAMVLFLLPAGCRRGRGGERLLRWKDAERLPWGVLILFGGGLSLAAAVRSSQLAEAIAEGAGFLDGVPLPVLILVVAAVVLVLTELTSNTATTTAIVPVVAAAAVGLGEDPVLVAVPVALAASGAFMLPVATPPNAVVFGSGRVPLAVMARSGIVINLLFLALIPIVTLTLVRWFLAGGVPVADGAVP